MDELMGSLFFNFYNHYINVWIVDAHKDCRETTKKFLDGWVLCNWQDNVESQKSDVSFTHKIGIDKTFRIIIEEIDHSPINCSRSPLPCTPNT